MNTAFAMDLSHNVAIFIAEKDCSAVPIPGGS